MSKNELPAPDSEEALSHAGRRFFAESVEDLEEAGADKERWVISNDQTLRFDQYVASRIKSLSRNQAQRLIDMGAATVNGEPTKHSRKLKEGDVVEVLIPPRPNLDIKGEDIPLEILYEDEGFLAVNKTRHIIVHPARSNLTGTMVNALVWHFEHHPDNQVALNHAGRVSTTQAPEKKPGLSTIGTQGLSSIGRNGARPGVIHRLDKDTTGVILFGKTEEAHWKIAAQFEFRQSSKAYLAVIHGCPEPLSGMLDQPLGKHPTIREAMCVRNDATGKHSLTFYRVRERYQGYSLVELDLKTGRTHQIRVHLAYQGWPIVGDSIYGGEPVGLKELDTPPFAAGARANMNFARTKEEGKKHVDLAVEREAPEHPDGKVIMGTPALHAGYLKISHPLTGEPMVFTAPLHEPMLTLIRELRKRPHPAGMKGIDDGTLIDLKKAIPE